MRLLNLLLIMFAAPAFSADVGKEGELKFAFYSAAWGENTDDGLRLVVSNQSSVGVVLEEVRFLKTPEVADDDILLKVGLAVPAGSYAEAEFPTQIFFRTTNASNARWTATGDWLMCLTTRSILQSET